MISESGASLIDAAEGILAPGTLVGGRYELVRELGRGAAGVVWQANHSLLASEVAVKFLDTMQLPGRDSDFLVERFRFEAQVSARLGKRTDRIVAVHDGGIFRGLPYIVMDLIEGESVEHRLDRQALPAHEVAAMVRQIASALDAAHAEGIAHRDVKPANILSVRSSVEGSYKLADFGVAKLFGAVPKGMLPPRTTAEQVLVGSPAYMSPETISGNPPWSGAPDTWALAVTAYECLTQRLPFDGDAWPTIAVAIMAGRYTPPSAVLGAAGEVFDPVFARAFATRAGDRYQSPSELADALEAVAKATPEANAVPLLPANAAVPLAGRSSAEVRATDPVVLPRTHWRKPVAAVLALLSLLGVVAWSLGGRDPAPAGASNAATAPATAVAVATVERSAQPPAVPPPSSSSAAEAEKVASASASSASSEARVKRSPLPLPPPPTAAPPRASETPTARTPKPPRSVDPSDTQ